MYVLACHFVQPLLKPIRVCMCMCVYVGVALFTRVQELIQVRSIISLELDLQVVGSYPRRWELNLGLLCE